LFFNSIPARIGAKGGPFHCVNALIMGVAVLPMHEVGGMLLFRTESSDSSEKILPRAAQIAGAIGWT